MPTIQAPGFNIGFNLGKHKGESQMALILTPYGEFKVKELPMVLGIAIDQQSGNKKKSSRAFLTDEENQVMGEDGLMYQVYYEDSAIPVLFKGDPAKKRKEFELKLQRAFDQHFIARIDEDMEKVGQDSSWDKIMLIVSIVCGTLLIIAAPSIIGALKG